MSADREISDLLDSAGFEIEREAGGLTVVTLRVALEGDGLNVVDAYKGALSAYLKLGHVLERLNSVVQELEGVAKELRN